jgi:hypothetical protein
MKTDIADSLIQDPIQKTANMGCISIIKLPYSYLEKDLVHLLKIYLFESIVTLESLLAFHYS